MIPPFHRDGYEVLDARCHVAATCATTTMAEQITNALNDAEALREKLALIAGRSPTLTEQAARAVTKDRP